MKPHQKIIILVVALALLLLSLGWVAGNQAVQAPGVTQTTAGVAQVSAANVEMAVLLPSVPFPGMTPNVHWNG